MEEKNRTKKAWETMRSKSPGVKAAYTKKRKKGARKAAAEIQNKQWDSEKVNYLKELQKKAISGRCIVCGDSRPYVLHSHHVDRDTNEVVILCANCHDTVRRGTLENLKAAERS
ncbi:MAG: hypothetical protein ABIL44_12560 [candidate division WOR-3 bacterium]